MRTGAWCSMPTNGSPRRRVACRRCARQAPDFIGQVRVASLFDAAGGGVAEAPSWLPRLLPRGVAYKGRVHEQPESDAAAPAPAAGRSAHDGYLDAQKASKARPQRAPARPGARGRPDDAYLHYQLGKDLELRSRFSRPSRTTSSRSSAATRSAGWRHDLVLRTLFTLKKLGRFARRWPWPKPRCRAGRTRPTSSSRSATCCSTGPRPSRRAAPSCCR